MHLLTDARRNRPAVGRSTALIVAAIWVAVAGPGCAGSPGRKASAAKTSVHHDHHRQIVDTLDSRLPTVLRRLARKRANTVSIEAVLADPDHYYDGVTLDQIEAVRQLYHANGRQPVWVQLDGTHGRLRESGQQLLETLHKAVDAEGLWADQLHLDQVDMIDFPRRPAADHAPAFAGVALTTAERRRIVDWLDGRRGPSQSAEDLDALTARLVARGQPLARLRTPVDEQTSRLADAAASTSRADVLLSDALVEYARQVRFRNPVWQQGRQWPDRLQAPPEETTDQSTTRAAEAGDDQSDAESRPSLDGQELVAARRRWLLVDTLGPVFDDPSLAADVLAGLAPRFVPYRRLTEAFSRYARIVRNGGWPHLPDAAGGLKKGATNAAISTVKKRLRLEGYWHGDDSQTFSVALKQAISTYQATHQLWQNGWLTPQTMRSLNVTATHRWNQIRLTLQRWRESRIGEDTHYVHVNIPDFHASVWKDNQRQMYFKIIVGATTRRKTSDGDYSFGRATPRFSDTMEYIVFNPYWNVPPSIRKGELEPKFKKKPDYMEKKGYEYHTDDNGRRYLRQKPGPKNALGQMKFLFPNKYSVYLHDTPSKYLFKKPFRAYSHGCVRIEDPMKFAKYLLDLDGRWTGRRRREKLDEWLSKEGPTWVNLEHPLPVHLEYYVVRVDDEGRANFLADLYRLDRPRLRKIAARVKKRHLDQPRSPRREGRPPTARSDSSKR